MDRIDSLKGEVTIGKDVGGMKRGWYICDKDSIHHLYRDGVIRAGVNATKDANAFWPTKSEAKGFYDGWRSLA